MSFELYYPAGGAVTVTLRNPDFGDVRRSTLNSEIRNNRSGELRAVRDSSWYTDSVYRYGFSKLTETAGITSGGVASDKISQIKQFLEDSAGDRIRIVDHLGDSRFGVILTPINEIINERDECSHDISFEFLSEATT